MFAGIGGFRSGLSHYGVFFVPVGYCEIDPYAKRAISKNLIMVNRAELLNGNSFITGVSGSGKSILAKQEIINLYLSDKDADIIIIDPEREYGKIMDAFGGENIEISATSKSHINAMDINMDYADGQNPVTLKSEYMLSLCEQAVCASARSRSRSLTAVRQIC